MVIVLVSSICVFLELLSCITGFDVLEKILVYDGTDGLACFQEDPVWVNDIGGWFLFFSLGHGDSHL